MEDFLMNITKVTMSLAVWLWSDDKINIIYNLSLQNIYRFPTNELTIMKQRIFENKSRKVDCD